MFLIEKCRIMRTISSSNLPQSRFFDVLSQLDNDAPLIALGNYTAIKAEVQNRFD